MASFSFDSVRGFRRPVYFIAFGQFVNLLGSGLVYPFATIHFHLLVGIPLSVVGLGLLANNVATAVGTAIGGYLADRYGRKPVMVTSMALSAVTLAAYAAVEPIAALVPRLTPGGAFILVASAAGLTLGLYAPASQAMIADLTTGSQRERGYALLKVANNAGFGIGFVIGGVLYGIAELSVFVGNGFTSGVVALVLLVALPRAHEARTGVSTGDSIGNWSRAISRPRIVALAGLNVGFAVMYAQMQATVPVVATETLGLSSGQLGTLYVLNPLVVVLFQLPLIAAVVHWRRTRGLVLSTGFWAAAMLAVWLVGDVPHVVGVALVGAFLVLRTIGELLHSPLITSLASELGAADERGSQLSLLEVANRLGFGLGAFVGGVFFDYGFANLLWPTLAVACGLLALGVLALERRVTPRENGVVVG